MLTNSLQSFVSSIGGFYQKSSVDQILILAWFFENQNSKSGFNGALMRQYFKEAGIVAPDMSVYLPRLASKKPPQIIKESGGYRLAGGLRRDLDKRLGGDTIKINIDKILSELPTRVPNITERDFLSEALKCYQVGAFRASIIMVWNLAFDHICRWLMDEVRLSIFNEAVSTRFPKKNRVSKIQDFEDFKESEIIELIRAARLIDKNTCQVLKDKLGRRNLAAHPSHITVVQHQADDMISDLVNNVILRI